MTDYERQKTLAGMDACTDYRDCKECPYDAEYDGQVGCMFALIKDMAEMIDEQAPEPRVLTLEELAAAQKTPVWRETKRTHKDLYNGWMLAYDIQRGQGITGTRQGMTEPNGRVGWCKLDDYGKTWRCWTSRPTDAQREAVKWDD